MNQIYNELGELVKSMGTTWFSNTLSAALQKVFNYDYFLLVEYQVDQPLKIIRSDFRNVEMQKPLDFLVKETYVAEPIYRLFNAGITKGGVFDMAELTHQSQSLSQPMDHSSEHLVLDNKEEIGWRTIGWPEHQQETCLLVPLTDGRLISVSLFNSGLATEALSNRDKLDATYPVFASAISRHIQIYASMCNEDRVKATNKKQLPANLDVINTVNVTLFFESQLNVTITTREAGIFTPLLQGNTLTAIAHGLSISIYTARTHRRNVYRKIGHGRLLELINQFHTFNSR